MSDLMKVGPDYGGSGTFKPFTADPTGAQRSGNVHAQFAVAALEGRLFSGGMTLTSISNVTFTSGTLGATCTPIAGVWNPSTSTVNLLISQAIANIIITAATNTGPGALVWATSTGNAAISTGNAPLNRRTLAAAGSQAKDMSGVALTGLTSNLVVRQAAGIGGGSAANFSFVGTAVGQATVNVAGVDFVDGAWVVPPGGVLALLATTTPVAHSAASGLMWEEIPNLP